jgi:glyoxylase-like metal-dependent hydrolase (beta-lactamase superfamily II)
MTLVDCGIYLPEEAEADYGWDHLVAALAACDVAPGDIERLVITHPHIDHYGMAGRLIDESGCELWMHEAAGADLAAYRDPEGTTRLLSEMLRDHGVGEHEIEELTAYEDWRPFVSRLVDADRALQGGESFAVGERVWTIVHTPGHSEAHVCLWSASDRILLSGDHLLGAITPHIDFRRGDENPLGDFLVSLQKIEDLAPDLVFPGHGRPFEDGASRARVVERHHDRRLGSILQVIRNEPHSADEITQEIFGGTLLHFEKRLALGEALAHIAYLREQGDVERIEDAGGGLKYQKVRRKNRSEEEDE